MAITETLRDSLNLPGWDALVDEANLRDIVNEIPSTSITFSNAVRIGVRKAHDFQRYVGGELSYGYQLGRIQIRNSWSQNLRDSWVDAIVSDQRSSVNDAEELRSADDWRRTLDNWVSEMDPLAGRSLDLDLESHDVYYNVVVHARPSGKAIRPFATFGTGISAYWIRNLHKDAIEAGLEVDSPSVRSDDQFLETLLPVNVSLGYNYGGGVKYHWSKKFGIRFDVRNRVTFKEVFLPPEYRNIDIGTMNNLEFSVTFTFVRNQGG